MTPWFAYNRSGRAFGKDSPSHATIDGKTTLCGLQEIGGHEPAIPFDPDGAWSCNRCAKKVRAAIEQATQADPN